MIPKLEVSHLCYSYHTMEGETEALSDLSFQVQTGEFLAVVGPSGCGKSTLLSLICGLLKPDSGQDPSGWPAGFGRRYQDRLHAPEGSSF